MGTSNSTGVQAAGFGDCVNVSSVLHAGAPATDAVRPPSGSATLTVMPVRWIAADDV